MRGDAKANVRARNASVHYKQIAFLLIFGRNVGDIAFIDSTSISMKDAPCRSNNDNIENSTCWCFDSIVNATPCQKGP
jgi:hypothetical protein